ncbi:conserved hypothetical protein [Agrobacterium fabrum str. J-07]|nr:conserved hypothetical protein [Agrobacterium fabrum str. J-07]
MEFLEGAMLVKVIAASPGGTHLQITMDEASMSIAPIRR